jgi:hypothetical protein
MHAVLLVHRPVELHMSVSGALGRHFLQLFIKAALLAGLFLVVVGPLAILFGMWEGGLFFLLGCALLAAALFVIRKEQLRP